MAPKKINAKEHFSDGQIDLSMSDLQDVPVKEIATLRQAYSLDLSHNHLKSLPANFASLLAPLTKIDLSQNQIAELPDNFGDLVKLRHLNLYDNQLQHLPLSFSRLKNLKYLDLKSNPLVPKLSAIAGDCLDAKKCQTCARNIVTFFSQLQEQVDTELETRHQERLRQEMEAKKNKKKEKAAAKQAKKELSGKDAQQKGAKKKGAKNNVATSKKTGETGSGSCLCLFTLFILSLIVPALFILTSIKCEYTNSLELAVRGLFKQGVEALPPNLRDYPTLAGAQVAVLHEKTGNVTLFVVDYVKNTDNLVEAYNALGEFIGGLLNKTKEQYKKFVS